MAALQPYFSEAEMEQIEAAYFFSKYAHRGQTRANGLRYFEHPRAVVWILFDELKIFDWQLLATALLHDMIEDSFIMSEARLELNFGQRVAMDVKYMTKEENLTPQDYWGRFALVGSWRAVVCKLADRLHNLRTLGDVDPQKRQRKIAETKKVVYPLFDIAKRSTPKRYTGVIDKLCEMIQLQVQSLEKAQ